MAKGKGKNLGAPKVENPEVTASGIIVPGKAKENLEAPTYDGAKDAKKGDAIVEWKEFGKVHTRVYSEEEQGEDFASLAETFAAKKGGKVIKK